MDNEYGGTDSNLEQSKSMTLFCFESSHLIESEFVKNILYCNLAEIKCGNIMDLAEGLKRFATDLCGVDEAEIKIIQYGPIKGGKMWPCAEVQVDIQKLKIEETLLQQIHGLLYQFVHMMTSEKMDICQHELFLQPPSADQLENLLSHVTQFRITMGGKPIGTPIKFFGKMGSGIMKGKFVPRPAQELRKRKVPDILAYFNGYKLSEGELYLLDERGKPITIFFDVSKQHSELIPLNQINEKIRFEVMELTDEKGRITLKLLAVLGNVNEDYEFFKHDNQKNG